MKKPVFYAEKPLDKFRDAKTGMLFRSGINGTESENRHLAMIALIRQAFALDKKPREVQGNLFGPLSDGKNEALLECLGCIKEMNAEKPVHLNARVPYKTLHATFKDAADLPVTGLTVVEALTSFNTNNNTALANSLYKILSSEKIRNVAYGARNYKGKGITSLNH